MHNENSKNILLASLISAIILISWTWFYEKPRMEAQKQNLEKVTTQTQDQKSTPNAVEQANDSAPTVKTPPPEPDIILSREEIIANSKQNRIQIKTPEIHGSINLKGAVFDDLTLVNYKEKLDPTSKEVVLFSPEESSARYFINFGFRGAYETLVGKAPKDSYVEYPDYRTVWKSSGVLTPQSPITLSWENKQKITFEINIAVDEHYMFTISQSIKNLSKKDIDSALVSEIQHFIPQTHNPSYIMHEGPIGVFDGVLKEKSYVNLRDRKDEDKNSFSVQNGWVGMTDKYWLASIIPDKKNSFETRFNYYDQRPGDLYEVTLSSKEFKVKSGESISFEQKMFAGAKKVGLLDDYSKKYNIALFDRAIDFGWYYFLTKPFFFILQFFNKIFGNYGLAILSITVLVKLTMFPLANKSYGALAKIKKLQPKIDKIRETYKDKKMQMNKEIMEMYKREKVNPVSGCLPMLIQIPVFFSLYKVLYLTIDMRHAPFYGWIKDLSAPDPTSVFNLFGLLPFETHGIFTIGIWPILMGITMIIQQKLNPKPSDPAQEKVMKILPFILIFVFAPFPAGLLIYWTWSNSLSILQQWYITRKFSK